MNRVLLMGKLTFDPDLKHTNSGLSVCNLSVATMERAERKTTPEAKPHFEYHRVVAWGQTAETCAKYLRKGSTVFIEGKLRTDTYERDGVKMKSTKVVVDNIKFLDSRPDEREDQGDLSDVPF